MKAIQPSEGPVAKRPAAQAPTQPSPALPAEGIPGVPARGTFQQLPTEGGQQSTVQPAAKQVTTGTEVKVVPPATPHREKRQG